MVSRFEAGDLRRHAMELGRDRVMTRGCQGRRRPCVVTPPGRSPCAHTLIVVVLRMTVLMGGLVSGTLIANRAIPDPQSTGTATLDGYYVAEQIAANKRNQNDMLFYANGSYTSTSVQDVEVSRYSLDSIKVALRVGSDTSTRVETGVPILSVSEVATP